MHNRSEKSQCSRTVRRWWDAVVLLTIALVAPFVLFNGCAAPEGVSRTDGRSIEDADIRNPVNAVPSAKTKGLEAVAGDGATQESKTLQDEMARSDRLENELADLLQKYTTLQERYAASESRISKLEKETKSVGNLTEPNAGNADLRVSEDDKPKKDTSPKAVEFVDYKVRYEEGLLGSVKAYFQFRNNSNKILTGVVYQVDYHDDFGDTLYTTEPLKHPMRVPPGGKERA